MPCVTGNIGKPDFAYSSRRYKASAQKCGGVQMKMINTSIHACIGKSFATAAQPRAGGIAPDKPPITIFCGVAGFRMMV
ncbi:hypothetical protein D3C81_1878270 [compost metagenome]